MNEHQNPFADPGASSRRSGAWRSFCLTAAALAVIGAGVFAWISFQQQSQQLRQVRAELEEARALADRRQVEAGELKGKLANSLSSVADWTGKFASNQSKLIDLVDQLTNSQARVVELEREKENVVQAHKGLEEEMRAELGSKDVTISQLQGKLTVNILDRILFDSGEAVLKSGGEAVLEKIAAILAQHPALKIHVIGHTDNVPIRPSARSRFTSNWELSTARALAAVRFLTEKAGVDPHRLGAVGYGEFRPVSDNSTAEGRGQNRRIAITILADELAGADNVPTVKTNLPAIPPPREREPDKSGPEG